MRLAVVADDSERLVRPEQAVRAAERLDDAFVVDDLVEIQRIHPFRVKSGEHLVHDNEQIELLAAVRRYAVIWAFVRQTR